MNDRRKIFWRDALLSGTKIGLVSVACSIVIMLLGKNAGIMPFLERVIYFSLIFVFVRKHSWKYSPEEGFSFGRAYGFVLAMLLFVGVIQGVYSAVVANYFMGPELLASLDGAMVELQQSGLYTQEMLGSAYETMKTLTFNPFAATISAVLGVEFSGLIIGLFVALFTRRRPDFFPMS